MSASDGAIATPGAGPIGEPTGAVSLAAAEGAAVAGREARRASRPDRLVGALTGVAATGAAALGAAAAGADDAAGPAATPAAPMAGAAGWPSVAWGAAGCCESLDAAATGGAATG